MSERAHRRAQHDPFCEKVVVTCRMGGKIRCTCGFDDERAMESREQLMELTRADEWQKIRMEMDELRAEGERYRQTVIDARYALVDAGSETACRAILEGKGLEDGIAEEYKSDLVRARAALATLEAQHARLREAVQRVKDLRREPGGPYGVDQLLAVFDALPKDGT